MEGLQEWCYLGVTSGIYLCVWREMDFERCLRENLRENSVTFTKCLSSELQFDPLGIEVRLDLMIFPGIPPLLL